MSEWQPIESAPRDGTIILIAIPEALGGDLYELCESRILLGWWDGGEFGEHRWECCQIESAPVDSEGGTCPFAMECDPTHWQPLPLPPAADGAEVRG